MRRRLLVAVLLVVGCKASEDAPTGLGTQVVKANVRELTALPGGQAAITLADVAPSKETGAPADVFVGSLTIVSVDGRSRSVGGGVTNLPGAWNASPDGGAVAFLAQYSVSRARGELRLVRPGGGEAESLGDAVTFHAFSGDGSKLAWVDGGELKVRDVAAAGSEGKAIAGEVAQFEFGPAGTPAAQLMLVKKTIPAKRALLLVDLATGKSTELAAGVGAYGFAPSGGRFAFTAESLEVASAFAKAAKAETKGFYLSGPSGLPRRVAVEGAVDFKFSPDGARLAYVAPSKLGEAQGDVMVVDGEGEAFKAASRVTQVTFAADGTMGVLAGSTSGLLGTFATLAPGRTGLAQEVARNVRHASFTRDGKFVVLTQATIGNSSFATELLVHPVGAPPDTKPVVIDVAPGGFEVDAASSTITYKSKCMDEGRACTLLVAPLAGGTPKQLLTRVAAFERLDGTGVAAVTSRRAGKATAKLAYALGVVDPRAPTPELHVLENEMTGDFAVLGEARDTLAYLVDDPKRAGLYLVKRDAKPATKP